MKTLKKKPMTPTQIHNHIADLYRKDLPKMIECHNWQIINGFPGMDKMNEVLGGMTSPKKTSSTKPTDTTTKTDTSQDK